MRGTLRAKAYFQVTDGEFDDSTFDLYCEIGPDLEIVNRLRKRLDLAIAQYAVDDTKNILMTDEVRPAWLRQPARLAALEKRLENAIDEVHSGRGGAKKKQRLLDAADEVREKVGKTGDDIKKRVTDNFKDIKDLSSAIGDWYLALILLGSGSEHLVKDVKIDLATRIATLASHLLHHLTAQMLAFNFDEIKEKVVNDTELIERLTNKDDNAGAEDTKRLITTLVEILEFSTFSWPYRFISAQLCELAHHKVLSRTLQNTRVDGKLANVIKCIWLIDIDSEAGEKALSIALRSLPKSYFFQMNIATHLMWRVYWSQSESKDRLAILSAAKNAIASLGLSLNSDELVRQIGKDDRRSKKAKRWR